ncbi:MAG: molybdopterin-dependent oxidoreductase [Desulfobacteraceae bacterium]|nr:molybdopterin-dependent oxidoreductase [Desulfobacteraceae bacterium]
MESQTKSNGEKIYKSACRMCHGGCGVLVHVEGDKVVKITGDPDSPLNRGKICPKGLASIEHLYHPDRLKYPLKRMGKRGEGQWKRISWDEALDTIVEKMHEISERSGVESIAIGTGTGRHHFRHVLRFANALGTPNWCEPGTAQCFIPRILTGLMTYGDMPVCDYYGDVNPACMLVWGHNPVISGPDGEIQFRVRECLQNGTKLIVVDPRRTEMAEKADLWLQLRPGTDDALALGMLHVMIDEEIYDKGFVQEWTIGFDRLAERVSKHNPEWAETITWVPAEKIRQAARLFAQTRPSVIEWGVAIEHTPNCLQTVRAVSLLPAITGNIDVPGGWIFGMHILRNLDIFIREISDEMKDKRMGSDKYKVLCSRDSLFPSAHIPTLFKAIRTGEPYPIKAFLIFGNNSLVAYANSKQVHETLMSLDFLLVMDIYMTPTAELADIVLPAATWLEVDEVVAVPYVADNVVLAQQKVTRMWECRQDEEVFVELARRLNLDVGIEPIEEIYNKQLAPLGISFDELKEKGHVSVPFKYRKFEENGFSTGSGKIELASSYLERLGYDPLPYYEEPPESPVSTPARAREYPLILTTGGRSQYYFHSEYRQIPSLRKRHPDPTVEIHPETAEKHNIGEDDWVWIETARGRIKQKAKITEGIDPRVVNVQHAWWFPEDPGPEYGVWKSNANVLTSDEPPYDPAIGTYQLRALLCKIFKAD